MTPAVFLIDDVAFFRTVFEHAIAHHAETNLSAALFRAQRWLVCGVLADPKPGVLRYRCGLAQDMSMPLSFYGYCLADMVPSRDATRGQVELLRNCGLIYDRHNFSWSVHT